MGECQTGHVGTGLCSEIVGSLTEQTQISQSARHCEMNLRDSKSEFLYLSWPQSLGERRSSTKC